MLFKTGIHDKYIPKSYQKKKKERKFYNIKQGRMLVNECDRVFCYTSRYATDQVDTEEKMADEFYARLRHEIRMALVSHGVLSYPEALSRALDMEVAMPGERPTSVTALAHPQTHSHYHKDKHKWDGVRGPPENKRPWQGPSRA